MSPIVIEGLSASQVNRLIRLQTEEVYNLTGQLVIATRRVADRSVSGARRERAERAIRAIPQQIQQAETAIEAMSAALREAGH